ncbi:phytoene desaturase family protein [Acetivibrio cellulolyticus]|uniref:phytoene desaturase family protein n=1 Tax=Acetivibrio cellulolyticus TaxID=35830 RepID=UPI0001E2EC40|nr:NAD(P)/FAD-dependent oxidoreductase [Acetivibrio cellulolyticus]
MRKKILIIGGGITGLVTGCYGQINGFETEIYEMHDLPGGFCTGWKRNGYLFDGCIHWLMGTNPKYPLYKAWERVGAIEGKEFIQHDTVVQVELGNGKKFTFYSDINRLEEELLKISPEDEPVIRKFADEIRSRAEWEKLIQPDFNNKYILMTKKEFIEQFKNPFLREIFEAVISGNNIFFFLMKTAVYNNQDAGWPIGGSLEFSKGIAKRYAELGGKIHYRSKVKKILVQDDRTTGIMLDDESIIKGDYIISAADGYSTVFKLLDGKYMNDEIKNLYDEADIIPSRVQVSMGINCDLSAEPHYINLKLLQPIKIGNMENTNLSFKNYCFDPTVSEPGKSVVISLISSDFEYWEELRKDSALYRNEKQRIALEVIKVLEERFPEAKGKVETIDVATPYTFHRYTDSLKGGYMGWRNPKQPIPTSLPGLKGLFLAGQWTGRFSGLPTALFTGPESIKEICQEEGCEFVY